MTSLSRIKIYYHHLGQVRKLQRHHQLLMLLSFLQFRFQALESPQLPLNPHFDVLFYQGPSQILANKVRKYFFRNITILFFQIFRIFFISGDGNSTILVERMEISEDGGDN